MSDFSIAKGKNTPEVRFSKKEGLLAIHGKSYPENARRFYDEVLDRMKEYTFPKTFTFDFNFEYLSSSSVVCILDILKILKDQAPATEFLIRFQYEKGDDDMQLIGENYEKLSGMKVQYVAK